MTFQSRVNYSSLLLYFHITMNHFRIYLLLTLLLPSGLSSGQGYPGSGGSGGFGGFGGAGRSSGSSTGILVRDTSDIYYFYADNPNDIFPFKDSLLNDFHQYDPIRQQAYDYAHLGNLGSAHRPLFYQPAFRRGFDAGFHQFDLYQMKTSDIRYYKLTQAYTQAGYSQGQTQADALTDVRFSRNFADGINLSLAHNRINNTGAYDNQKATNSNVAVGLWYHNKYGNYDGFLSLVTNSVEQQNNGGITENADTIIIDAFQVDVQLANSNTRYASKEYAYTQYFYLNKILSDESKKRRADKREKRQEQRAERKAARELARQLRKDSTLALVDSLQVDSLQLDSLKTTVPPDSLQQAKTSRPGKGMPGQRPGIPGQAQRPDSTRPPGTRPPASRPPGTGQAPLPEGRTFTLYHQLAWRTESYKFSALPSDSLFYGEFWTDRRGLRHYLETRKLQNTFKLQTFQLKPRSGGTISARSLPRQSDLLEVGLVHTMNIIDQEAVDTSNLHNLFLTGRFNFSPSERLRIQTYGHLGLAANAGDFRLSGELFLNFRNIGNLQLEAVNQLYTPSLVEHQFFATEERLWRNNFDKTLETTLKGTYSLPSIHLSITGQYHLTNNLIYFDTDGLPKQAGSAISIFQLILRKDFHLKPLHLENRAGLQENTSDVLRLPSFYSKHSLYVEGRIFRRIMLARFGFDARLANGYTPYAYQPLTGQFYLQNEQDLPFTPLIDVFLNIKVKTFRFFFKAENLLTFFTDTYFFQTAEHPLPFGFANGGIRMGINWRLVD